MSGIMQLNRPLRAERGKVIIGDSQIFLAFAAPYRHAERAEDRARGRRGRGGEYWGRSGGVMLAYRGFSRCARITLNFRRAKLLFPGIRSKAITQ